HLGDGECRAARDARAVCGGACRTATGCDGDRCQVGRPAPRIVHRIQSDSGEMGALRDGVDPAGDSSAVDLAVSRMPGSGAMRDEPGRCGDRVAAGVTMRVFRVLLTLLLLLPFTGCSYVASLFPDKQKQYQYTTEIPPLEVPPDLSISTVSGARWRNPDGSTSAASPGTSPVAAGPDEASDEATSKATLAQNTEDVPLIELALP